MKYKEFELDQFQIDAIKHIDNNKSVVVSAGTGTGKTLIADYLIDKAIVENKRVFYTSPIKALSNQKFRDFKAQFGNKIGFCGNSDIQVWETGDKELIRREVLRKLNAAKGGGFIFQSDHSVSSGVSGHTYDYIVNLVREYGKYPLQLGDYDEEI